MQIEDKYTFCIEELGCGRFVDYETIPYWVDTVTEDGDLVLTPLNHDWKPEPAHIGSIEPIRITDKFLLANKWEESGLKKNLDGEVIIGESSFILKHDTNSNFKLKLYRESGVLYAGHSRWPVPVLYIHQLQNIMISVGMKIREMTFLPEYYESNCESEK